MPQEFNQISLPAFLECRKCHIVKPLDEFRLEPRNKTHGHTAQCIECLRAYAREHARKKYRDDPDAARKSSRDWYWRNRDKALENARSWRNSERGQKYRRRYRIENAERISAYNRAWYRNNLDHALTIRRTYRESNRDKMNALTKSWRERNKDRCKANAVRWQSANRQRVREKQRLWVANNYTKHIERKRKYRSDHPDQFRRYARESSRARRVGRDKESYEFSKILRKDPCSYCGRYLPIAIDHIVPVAKGGTSDVSNLTAACYECNGRKSARGLLEFLLTNNPSSDKEAA